MLRLKYVLLFSRLLMTMVLGLQFYLQSNFNTTIVYFVIAVDFILRAWLWIWIKMQIEKNEMIFVGHRRFMNKTWVKLISTLIVLSSLSILVILGIEVDSLALATNILLGYFLIIGFLFYNGFDGYIMGRKGIVQPEIFSTTYTWDQVRAIKLWDDAIEMIILEKEYHTDIEFTTSKEIIEFLERLKIDHHLR